MALLSTYEQIMLKEAALKDLDIDKFIARHLPLAQPRHIFDITKRIIEIALNSTVIRSGNITSALTNDSMAFESDGAHTNLVRSLVKYAMDIHYGWGNSSQDYDRFEIDEAITLHDLPENLTGDIPDNRNRDEAKKAQIENHYFDRIITTYVGPQSSHRLKIRQLLQEMQDKTSFEGRMLYVADKVSAILMMLCYDRIKLYPSVHPDDPSITKVNREEISLCEKQQNGNILLSELWTVDFLYGRNIVQYDETRFFLAILVMATLWVRGEWYGWREAQYPQ